MTLIALALDLEYYGFEDKVQSFVLLDHLSISMSAYISLIIFDASQFYIFFFDLCHFLISVFIKVLKI